MPSRSCAHRLLTRQRTTSKCVRESMVLLRDTVNIGRLGAGFSYSCCKYAFASPRSCDCRSARSSPRTCCEMENQSEVEDGSWKFDGVSVPSLRTERDRLGHTSAAGLQAARSNGVGSSM